jgi:hypothetical protein
MGGAAQYSGLCFQVRRDTCLGAGDWSIWRLGDVSKAKESGGMGGAAQ